MCVRLCKHFFTRKPADTVCSVLSCVLMKQSEAEVSIVQADLEESK